MHAPTPKRGLSVGVMSLCADASVMHQAPILGEVLLSVQIVTSVGIAVVLLAMILVGCDTTCERAFRLLRWTTDRPEPPSPKHTPPLMLLPVAGVAD